MGKIFLTFSFVLFAFTVSAQEIKDFVKKNHSFIELEPDYTYALFEANNEYLAWVELYTNTFFYKNLSTGLTKEIILKKGRGPGEYLSLTSLVLMGNIAYLLDPNNVKIIKIDLKKNEIDDMHIGEITPLRMSNARTEIIFMEMANQESLFYSLDVIEGEGREFALHDLNLLVEFKNLFYRDGQQVNTNRYLIHSPMYLPSLYIFDLKRKEFLKKVQFDETNIDDGASFTNDSGAKVTLPPDQVDVLMLDLIHIPARANTVFILAKGKSKNRTYGTDKLFEYDFVTEEFAGTYDLNIQAKELTVNDNNLFVYSEEEYRLYQFEFIQDN